MDSFIELLPETHKDDKRVPDLNGRSLILIAIPDSLSISGGQFEVKQLYREVPFPPGILRASGRHSELIIGADPLGAAVRP